MFGCSQTPYYAVLADALARHVSADAATSCLSRYTLREATTLRQLVEGAGFGLLEMHVLEVMRRMPASPASVVEDIARAPYARDVAAVAEDVRQAVGQEVSAALHTYRDGDAVVIPIAAIWSKPRLFEPLVCNLNRSHPWTPSADTTPPSQIIALGGP